VLVAVIGLAHAARAQCALPQVTPAPAGLFGTPAARYAQALTYADHQCLTEAKGLLAEAAAGLASQTGTRPAILRNLVASATEYVGALEAIARGDRNAGYAMLQRIVDRGPNAVGLRAALTLGTAIVRDRDDTRWQAVAEPLVELSRRGHVEAELLLVERVALRSGIPAAIAAVEKQLGEDHDLQRGLSLEVFLIELYSRANRWIDAELLLSVVERDAAETLLDLKMRKRLLEAGLAVSTTLVQQGRTEFTDQRDAYARALLELKRFTS